MGDQQIKMAFSVDRKKRGIKKITQFSYIEPYQIVIFASLKKNGWIPAISYGSN